jgi:Sec-independent protein secretion pathway component TatC
VRSFLFVFVAFLVCWFFSDRVYNFLAVPVQRALAEAQRRELPIGGLTGKEVILPLNSLKEGDTVATSSARLPRLARALSP